MRKERKYLEPIYNGDLCCLLMSNRKSNREIFICFLYTLKAKKVDIFYI